MLFVYMNSPNQRISVHQDSECNQIQAKQIPNQRVIHIDSTNVESELQKLRNKELTFAATRGLNDVWFYIDLENASLEKNLVKKIHQ